MIPVVVSPDDNYAVPSYIMLHSLIRCMKKDEKCDIIILANSLEEQNRNLFKSLQLECNNIQVRFLDVNNSFSDTEIVLSHISRAALFRLLLPVLLPEYSKCIYIDGDVLVVRDVLEAFKIELGENYIAAVRDIEAERYIRMFEYEVVPPTDTYINSGFLIMNLRKMREDGMIDKFLELTKKKFLFIDQDILNICCHGKILLLPLKYNAMVKYRFLHYKLKEYNPFIMQFFSLEEIYEAQDSPIIIHYAQPVKPWQCKYVYNGVSWMRYAKTEIDNNIYMKVIRPYINKNKKRLKVQIKFGIRYILSKFIVYKYILKKIGKI